MERVSIFISCDEAPAATCGGSTGKRILTARKSGDFLRERSDQPRCCGNPSWTKPAGIHGGWLHCNIQFVCQPAIFIKSLNFNSLLDVSQLRKSEFQSIR